LSRVLIGKKSFMLSRGERLERAGSSRVGAFLFALILFLLALLWVDAYVRSLTRSYQYRVSDLNREVQELEKKKMELQSEIAKLRNPRRIERIAVTKLGLVEPDSKRIIKER